MFNADAASEFTLYEDTADKFTLMVPQGNVSNAAQICKQQHWLRKVVIQVHE